MAVEPSFNSGAHRSGSNGFRFACVHTQPDHMSTTFIISNDRRFQSCTVACAVYYLGVTIVLSTAARCLPPRNDPRMISLPCSRTVTPVKPTLLLGKPLGVLACCSGDKSLKTQKEDAHTVASVHHPIPLDLVHARLPLHSSIL